MALNVTARFWGGRRDGETLQVDAEKIPPGTGVISVAESFKDGDEVTKVTTVYRLVRARVGTDQVLWLVAPGYTPLSRALPPPSRGLR